MHSFRNVRLLLLALALYIAGCSSGSEPSDANSDISLDTAAAQEAFVYLNLVRQDPDAYSDECNYDLSNIQQRPVLTYNATLEKVARAKALDMANRNYMAHQDPDGKGIDHVIENEGYPLDKEDYFVDQSTANYESLQSAGTSAGVETLTGTKSIRDLIWDGGMANGGHREHLLGVGMRGTLDEIGIGFVRCKLGAMFKNYCCVIIAKRKH